MYIVLKSTEAWKVWHLSFYVIFTYRGGFREGGGLGGRETPPPPPRCLKKNFFALKIRKRNKACTIHCTVTPARVRWGIN